MAEFDHRQRCGYCPQFSPANGIYFSCITLITVGYGDFVPGNDIVHRRANMEASTELCDLAVMMARLKGLSMRAARSRHHDAIDATA